MYGLVNKAVEQMVRSGHGDETWERIKSKAAIEVEGFISTEPYPDEVTYALVAAASEELGAPADEILQAFGEYWVLNTALDSYGPLMRAVGATLKDFLLNLPHLHTRVELIYPELTPPQFECRNVGEDQLDFHYWTARPPGLEPFVEGLLKGLGKMFSTPMRVELTQHRDEGYDQSIFHVSWDAAA